MTMRRLRRAAAMMPHGRGAVLLLVSMFASVVAAALAHVSLRLAVIRLGYSISERTRERQTLEDENRKLRIELSLLRNPERIERLARDKLGMARPEPGQIRVVKPAGGAP